MIVFHLWKTKDGTAYSLHPQGHKLDKLMPKLSKIIASFEVPEYNGDTERQINHASKVMDAILFPEGEQL